MSGFSRRLAAALADSAATGSDVAPLLRQEFAMLGPGGARSSVPARFSRDELERVGVAVNDAGVVSNVMPYRPSWLAGPVDSIAEVHAAGGPTGHADLQWKSLPSDPVVAETLGFDHYRGAGQRDAVRAALRAPAGAVMGVVLPTGTGKTLAGLARGLAGQGTTVVIVPTVALALDQERLLRERSEQHDLPYELAYHGTLPDEVRDRIRQRLRDGTQRLVYCSPEAAIGTLAHPLTELAQTGRLDTLVIDECHLVNAWGETFRPEFQLLPALRRLLVSAADDRRVPAPVTILLTATLTEDTLQTLRTLFDLPEENLIEVQRLRPEPRYLLASPGSQTERVDQLAEVLAHAPRPAIVYVTRPRDAERLTGELFHRGFSRLRVFHGATSGADRDAALDAWAGRTPTADVMVATSAFGLGVDVPDVRTVVHACLPESIDRFYQEVGRGGRDGAPSLSILMPVLPDPSALEDQPKVDDLLESEEPAPDLNIARSLSQRKAIGDPKGANRWRTLRRGATVEGAFMVTDVRLRPPKLADVGQAVLYDSPRNREWNWSTLNLLARSGAVRLQLRRPDAPPDDLEADETRIRRFFDEQHSRVFLLPGSRRPPPPHEGTRKELETGFATCVSDVRSRMRDHADASLAAMLRVARGEACTARMLASEYARTVETEVGRARQAPAGACTGCPVCGAVPPVPSPDVTAAQSSIFPVQPRGPLAEFLGPDGSVIVLMPDELRARRRANRDLLTRLIRQGVPHVVLLGEVSGIDDSRLLSVAGTAGKAVTAATKFDRDANPPVPTVVILGRGDRLPREALLRSSWPLVLLVAQDTIDPRDDRGHRISETSACVYYSEVEL
jgi:ATP-dependent DNA helicase RecQ